MAGTSEKFKRDLPGLLNSRVRYVVSLGLLFGGGYFGWFYPSETEAGKQCKTARNNAAELEMELYAKGTLGRECLFCGEDIRDFSDMISIQRLGNLRNQRDHICGVAEGDFKTPSSEGARLLAAAGLFGLLIPHRQKKT